MTAAVARLDRDVDGCHAYARPMQFTRAHGTGNDFVVLVDLDDRLSLDPVLVRALCHRRWGVGADGVLRIGGASDGADVFMDYRNADGSVVEMCGNGVRVVAKHVVDHQYIVPHDGVSLVVGTRSGPRPVTVHVGNDGCVDGVTVDMGPPAFEAADVGVDPSAASPAGDGRLRIDLGDDAIEVSTVGMGNPHAVAIVDEVDAAPVRTVGPAVEHHPAFPNRVNVGFAQVVDRERVRLRVWERGVGETAACGTGACATAVALQRLGLVGTDVTVSLPGGELRVHWEDGGTVMMTGPAVEVSHGTLDEAWLRAAHAGALEPVAVAP